MGQAARRKKILAPLDQLGLRKINHIEEALEEHFGKTKAVEILSGWERLSETENDKPGEQNALYEYLNSDYDLSMLAVCYTDAAIIRTFCLWIYDHRDLFGKTILDAGCGTGIIACFLAKIMPDAQITAIDCSGNSIRIARQVQEKMGVSNIVFLHGSIEDFREPEAADLPGQSDRKPEAADFSEQSERKAGSEACSQLSGTMPAHEFDTVFSSRTFHENIGIRYTDYRFLPFSRQVQVYEDIYRDYVRQLCSLLSPGGRLVCIERNHWDTEYYALLRTVEDTGFRIVESSLTQLECEESDFRERSVFECFAAEDCRKDRIEEDFRYRKAADENAENSNEAVEGLFQIWSRKAFYHSDNPDTFTRSQTDYYLETHAGEQIEGYRTYDPDGTQLGCAGIFRTADGSGNFLLYQANYGRAGVKILTSGQQLAEAKAVLADHRRVDRANGFTVRNLSAEDCDIPAANPEEKG